MGRRSRRRPRPDQRTRACASDLQPACQVWGLDGGGAGIARRLGRAANTPAVVRSPPRYGFSPPGSVGAPSNAQKHRARARRNDEDGTSGANPCTGTSGMTTAQPRALRVLSGEHPERVSDAEPEPALTTDLDEIIPEWFERKGPAWRTLQHHVEVLGGVKVLTVADGEALALGCDSLRMYLVYRHKDWRRASEGARRYWQMLIHFGLTPASRTKISVVQPKTDPLADWQARRNAAKHTETTEG